MNQLLDQQEKDQSPRGRNKFKIPFINLQLSLIRRKSEIPPEPEKERVHHFYPHPFPNLVADDHQFPIQVTERYSSKTGEWEVVEESDE